MASQGYVIARVYTSDAYIPLVGVPVSFTLVQPDGRRSRLAVRTTDENGLTRPVTVDTPDVSQSLSPGPISQPYATVDIATGAPGFGSAQIRGVQIFPGVETIQGLQLKPQPAPPAAKITPDAGNIETQ